MGQAENERKNKISFLSVPSQSEIWNSKKNSKKIQKIKEHHYGFFSSENRMGQAVGNAKKKKLSFKSIPTRPEIWISKKIAKNGKKK